MSGKPEQPVTPAEERVLTLGDEAHQGVRRLRAAVDRVSRKAASVPSSSVMQTGNGTSAGPPSDFAEAIAWLDAVRQQTGRLVEEAP